MQRAVALDVIHLHAVNADFALLGHIGPLRLFSGRLFQTGYLRLQLFVLRLLKGILPLLILHPCGKIPPAHLDIGSIDRQDMIHAAIQECSVVGYQDKPPLGIQIPAHQLPPPDIQMVRRLVNQQEIVFLAEQHRQLELGPLSVAQRLIGAVKHLVIQLELPHLPGDLPVFKGWIHCLRRLQRGGAAVRHRVREIGKIHRRADASLVLELSPEQIHKGRFSPAIPAGKAQLPVCIQLKADVFKNVLVAALIGKGQILYLNQ